MLSELHFLYQVQVFQQLSLVLHAQKKWDEGLRDQEVLKSLSL